MEKRSNKDIKIVFTAVIILLIMFSINFSITGKVAVTGPLDLSVTTNLSSVKVDDSALVDGLRPSPIRTIIRPVPKQTKTVIGECGKPCPQECIDHNAECIQEISEECNVAFGSCFNVCTGGGKDVTYCNAMCTPQKKRFTCSYEVTVELCSDTDGDNPYKLGYVKLGNKKELDFCSTSGRRERYEDRFKVLDCSGTSCYVAEHVCSENRISYKKIKCEDGCSNGACVKKEEKQCIDNDVTPEYPRGRNYYKQGTVTSGEEIKIDKCDEGYSQWLIEYLCRYDQEIIEGRYLCSKEGKQCYHGACMSELPFEGYMSVATLKDFYNVGETIKLTDPPAKNTLTSIIGNVIKSFGNSLRFWRFREKQIQTAKPIKQFTETTKQFKFEREIEDIYPVKSSKLQYDIPKKDLEKYHGYIVQFKEKPLLLKEKELKKEIKLQEIKAETGWGFLRNYRLKKAKNLKENLRKNLISQKSRIINEQTNAKEKISKVLMRKISPITEIRYIEELREKYWGIYAGKHASVAEKAMTKCNKPTGENSHAYLFKPKGGESFKEFTKRMIKFYNHLVQNYQDKNLLLITYGGNIRFLLIYLFGNDWKNYEKYWQDNAALSIIEVNKEGEHEVKLMNCTKHLENVQKL